MNSVCSYMRERRRRDDQQADKTEQLDLVGLGVQPFGTTEEKKAAGSSV